ncbi:AfsR/SARP family transcriptional regulator, partial [Streptomyces sp. TRM64462]|uniref:AfsR/SARP family transcriptional regulator n=1 Tax=Streptomyces sp. TRM64462 TaxID=2741726 RepID=UPI0015863856
MLEVRLLGPAEVWDGDRRIPLTGPKPTAILAALVVHAGEVLSTERLVDLVWEEKPPVTARALVASHVSALRRALAGAAAGCATIGTRSPGYVAELPRDRIDAHRFEQALALGRRTAAQGRPAEAADILRDALGLWRGQDALEGLGQSFARIEAARLAELRRVGLEARFAAELAVGCRAEIVAELYAAVAANPLRERLRGQLMTALFRTGRLPDALRVYQEGRDLLRTELGLDPGPVLRTLHQALLTGDTTLLGPPTTAAVPEGPAPSPPPAADTTLPATRTTATAPLSRRIEPSEPGAPASTPLPEGSTGPSPAPSADWAAAGASPAWPVEPSASGSRAGTPLPEGSTGPS